jgi:hypothetical protein
MQQYQTFRGLENEGRLWLLSFVLAVVLVLAAFFVVGLLSLLSHISHPTTSRPIAPKDQIVIVMAPPKLAAAVPTKEPETPKQQPRFTRTSADQASAPPEKADFIGNRDTTATSDALPVLGAPDMPSQAGRDLPKRSIETTESRAQLGKLDDDSLAKAKSQPTPPTPPAPVMDPTLAQRDPSPTTPPPAELATPQKNSPASPPLLNGDQVVERPKMPEEAIKPTLAEKQPTPAEEKPEPQAAALPKPKPQQDPNEPGFRGNQQKTKLSGSISRKGRSALNVANTAMGRYQAAISRAVEHEWHGNCTKYRDFITPGILTVRFVIGSDGAVRSVSVVEMVDAGEVQKGFTLGAIRQAKIPPLPADLKAELDGDPIELIYNFYF